MPDAMLPLHSVDNCILGSYEKGMVSSGNKGLSHAFTAAPVTSGLQPLPREQTS